MRQAGHEAPIVHAMRRPDAGIEHLPVRPGTKTRDARKSPTLSPPRMQVTPIPRRRVRESILPLARSDQFVLQAW